MNQENFYTGFIALYRSIQKHWLWDHGNEIKLKWWIDILMECNHKERKVNFGFQLYNCKRGQTINSLQGWAKKWRVDVSTVRRFFDLLQKDKMIELENLTKTTRLTVCNYDNYQDFKHDKQSIDNGQTIDEQSMNNLKTIPMQFEHNTNNNYNNSNNSNHLKNERETAPTLIFLKKEERKYSELELQFFKKLTEFIKKELHAVAKMPQQLTIEKAAILLDKYPGPEGEKLIVETLKRLNDAKSPGRNVFNRIEKFISTEQDESLVTLRNRSRKLAIKTENEKKQKLSEEEFYRQWNEKQEQMNPEQREEYERNYQNFMKNVIKSKAL